MADERDRELDEQELDAVHGGTLEELQGSNSSMELTLGSLQDAMEQENREYRQVSSVAKSRHETAKTVIRKVR